MCPPDEIANRNKRVLDGVTGTLRSGRTCAVMGPSGCGKTTFLTALAGRATYGSLVGRIEINGAEDSLLKYPKLVAFVPQEDVMHRCERIVHVCVF